MQITVVDHPLLQAKMTVLRDVNTDCPTFRRTIGEAAMLLAFEAARNIPVDDCRVLTPLCETDGKRIHGTVNIIPILRAGSAYSCGWLRQCGRCRGPCPLAAPRWGVWLS